MKHDCFDSHRPTQSVHLLHAKVFTPNHQPTDLPQPHPHPHPHTPFPLSQHNKAQHKPRIPKTPQKPSHSQDEDGECEGLAGRVMFFCNEAGGEEGGKKR